ncbi:uncharacterized protein LOC113495357 [Trichoplusia ni]|uniref:Uncharacterized protein LOC113495357 n=1 Tax=Trichoplusia ni TaxID=7111 RepID=A0A7E5VNV0_TRINI|nr:uncharacterized protein LOC113495357 [Trichoplusia ni]
MWKLATTVTALLTVALGTEVAPGLHREVSNEAQSLGFKVIYGDEDLTVINQVVSEAEKNDALKSKYRVNEAIKPLPAVDVKCLMSVDRYCTKEMGALKSVLIQAIKEDCAKCSTKQKDDAGKVIAAMMAHDPVAWKLFLTRSALQTKPREAEKREELRLKLIGEPEEVIRSPKNRYTMPGVKVRVKRYMAEKLP